MTKEDLPGFDCLEEPETPQYQVAGEATSTETIDLSSLLSQDVYASGTFDLSSVGSTSFGRLLDALPVPAIVIDHWHHVGFTNRSCTKLSPGYKRMCGVPFLDFLPRPADAQRARALTDKTIALLEKVFETRKPQVAETILEIHQNRIWARLHLRAVRIASDRHLLVLIEDLTNEKKQIELSRRQEKAFREMRRDLIADLEAANSELSRTGQRCKREEEEHIRTRRALHIEEQKSQMLAELGSLATAVVAPTGTFQHIDKKFREMFGFELIDLPGFGHWIIWMGSDTNPLNRMWGDSLETLNQPDEGRMAPAHCTVLCQDRTRKEVRINGLKLADGNYFITCEEADRPRSE